MTFGDYEVLVTARSNCRHMILRCQPGSGGLKLSVPPRTSQAKILAFLEAHRAWIEAHAKPAQRWQAAYAPGERHWALGVPVKLGEGDVPAGETAFAAWRAQQLIALITTLTAQWQVRMGVQPRRIRFRDMSSRWGSCQVRTHDLTFNLRLGAMPPACVEYVVVHELCHLIHPDHSAAFHAVLTQYLPDWQEQRRRLNHFDASPLPPAP